MDFKKGQIVFSKTGRDKGKPFIITKIENDYVYLVDGVYRTLEKPKKKKIKHVQKTNNVVEEIAIKLNEDAYINNKLFSNKLKEYMILQK